MGEAMLGDWDERERERFDEDDTLDADERDDDLFLVEVELE